MQILITGATGFLGQKLARQLIRTGHKVRGTSRNAVRARQQNPDVEWFGWDFRQAPPAAALENCDAVIHLMGENIGQGRWSAKRKALIHDSRI
ncbi:MAG: NAD-dependent epimerase/dehydratase family protein, partial [Leptospiraceae bacterium]|nr:NAD-dependent epimerase/dehydratase family protein [Leptospiraceae bacterium]